MIVRVTEPSGTVHDYPEASWSVDTMGGPHTTPILLIQHYRGNDRTQIAAFSAWTCVERIEE